MTLKTPLQGEWSSTEVNWEWEVPESGSEWQSKGAVGGKVKCHTHKLVNDEVADKMGCISYVVEV